MLTVQPTKLGELKIVENSQLFTLEIRQANALCAVVYIFTENGKRMMRLWSFFADEQHLKNYMKHEGRMFGKIYSMSLNLKYKESKTLLKYALKSGYEVTYYSR